MVEYNGLLVNLISTWSPRICGIGSFSQDTINAISPKEETIKDIKIHPIDKEGLKYIYPIKEKHVINQIDSSSWIGAAEIIKERNHRRWAQDGLKSIVLLEHEYGLDGNGLDNNYNLVAKMLKEEKIPVVSVLHTILRNPDDHQKRVLQELGENSNKLIVITPSAKTILRDSYDIDIEKVEYIPHGIPIVNRNISKDDFKSKFGFDGKVVLSTPGLVSEGKGLEYGLLGFSEALKNIEPSFRKNMLYLIAGQTHPEILKENNGKDPYREKLQTIVNDEKLEDNVQFMNQHLEDNTLYGLIRATDIGIIPYLNEQQISSGILSYFVGIGTPCVSSNFVYARDLFSDQGRNPFHIDELLKGNKKFERECSGVLTDLKNPTSIAKAIKYISNNYESIETNEYKKGVTMGWPVVGTEMVSSFINLVSDKKTNICKIPFMNN